MEEETQFAAKQEKGMRRPFVQPFLSCVRRFPFSGLEAKNAKQHRKMQFVLIIGGTFSIILFSFLGVLGNKRTLAERRYKTRGFDGFEGPPKWP